MTRIIGMKRLDETILPCTGHGDNWYMTWAEDDKQYAGLCDGTGFPDLPDFDGRTHNSKLFSISGDPPDHVFDSVRGYPALEHVADDNSRHLGLYSRYYGFAIIALDGFLFQFLSTPKVPFGPVDNAFIGAKLIYSPDDGETWLNQDGSPVGWETWEERSPANLVFFHEPGDCFSLCSLLQMGKGYEDNTDGYVYLYAPNGNVDGSMNQLVMLRVDRTKILERSAYQYFVSVGTNGTANWSGSIEDRGVVYEFPRGWVNWNVGPGHSGHPYAWQPSVVYNKPLGVYMMANWGIGVGGDGDWFGKPSYLGFWTAPQPWGPWTQVYEEREWKPGGDKTARAYQPYIAPKWIAPDGTSFWLVWTDFRLEGGESPYYGFNCQKVEVLVAE